LFSSNGANLEIRNSVKIDKLVVHRYSVLIQVRDNKRGIHRKRSTSLRTLSLKNKSSRH